MKLNNSKKFILGLALAGTSFFSQALAVDYYVQTASGSIENYVVTTGDGGFFRTLGARAYCGYLYVTSLADNRCVRPVARVVAAPTNVVVQATSTNQGGIYNFTLPDEATTTTNLVPAPTVINTPVYIAPNTQSIVSQVLSQLGNLVGLPGPKGDKGDKGDTGAPGTGSTVYSSSPTYYSNASIGGSYTGAVSSNPTYTTVTTNYITSSTTNTGSVSTGNLTATGTTVLASTTINGSLTLNPIATGTPSSPILVHDPVTGEIKQVDPSSLLASSTTNVINYTGDASNTLLSTVNGVVSSTTIGTLNNINLTGTTTSQNIVNSGNFLTNFLSAVTGYISNLIFDNATGTNITATGTANLATVNSTTINTQTLNASTTNSSTTNTDVLNAASGTLGSISSSASGTSIVGTTTISGPLYATNTTIGGDTTINGGTTTINGVVVNNAENIFNSTSTFNGPVVMNGELITNATVTNNGPIFNNGTTTNNGEVINNSTTTNNGTSIFNGIAQFFNDVFNYGNIFNYGTTTNNGIVINNNEVINNATTTNNGPVVNNGPVTNYGTTTLEGPVVVNGTTTFNGVVDLSNASVTFPNSPIPNATITNLVFTNATGTNLTLENASITNATVSNLFADILNAFSAFFTNLTATNATVTNLVSTNSNTGSTTATSLTVTGSSTLASTTINGTLSLNPVASGSATSSLLVYGPNGEVQQVTPAEMLASNTTNVINYTGDASNTLLSTVNGVVSSTTIGTLNNINLTGTTTAATITVQQLDTTGLTAVNATLTNATTSNLFATNASITNATTSNFFADILSAITGYISNLIFDNATGTNITATGTASLATIVATTTNTQVLNASTTNTVDLSATNATITNLVTDTATFGPGTTTITGPLSLSSTTLNSMADNGLSAGVDGKIEWGGVLHQNTLIDGVLNTFSVDFLNTKKFNVIDTTSLNLTSLFSAYLRGHDVTVGVRDGSATGSVNIVTPNVYNGISSAGDIPVLQNLNGAIEFQSPASILAGATTNILGFATSTNILSSTVNGVLATTSINLNIPANGFSIGAPATTTNSPSFFYDPVNLVIYYRDTNGNIQYFWGPKPRNGLTNTTGNFQELGGTLIHNTTVNQGSFAMSFVGAGNFGIGTSTPNNKLEITHGTAGNSGLRFTNLTSSNSSATTSNKVLTVSSSGDVVLATVPGTENIVEFSVNANPNTGGTIFSPNQQNDPDVIYASTLDNSTWKWNGSTYVTYTPTPTLCNVGSQFFCNNGNLTGANRILGTNDNFNLGFETNNVEKMTLFNLANPSIGIGRTSLTGVNGGASSYSGPTLFTGAAGNFSGNTGWDFIMDDDNNATNNQIRFRANGDGAANTIDIMTVDEVSGGRVGIGNTAPGNKLEITQGTSGNSGLRFTNLTSSNSSATTSNKVLTVNSSGDVVLATVPGTENIVEFSVNANPNIAGTTFSPNQQNDPDVIYASTLDNSTWKWNGSTYVTYTPTPTLCNVGSQFFCNNGNLTGANRILGTNDNFNLGFETNNVEKMTLFSLANPSLGIGRTSLTGVNGGASSYSGPTLFTGAAGNFSGSTGWDFIMDDDNNATNNQIRFRANGDGAANTIDIMTVDEVSGGRVGIGNTAPGNKLEITQGTSGNSGLRFTNLTSSNSSATTSNKVLTVNSSGDVVLATVPGTENIVEFSVNANPNIAGTTFSPNQQNDPDVIYTSTIDNSTWKWNGSTYVTYTPTPTLCNVGSQFHCNNGNLTGADRVLGTNDNFAQTFETNNLERMRISNTGNVSIGTTTTNYKFSVVDTASAFVQTLVQGGGSGGGIINRLVNDSGKQYFVGVGGSSNGTLGADAFFIRDFTLGQNRIVVASTTGNVGIGNYASTMPSHKLTVQGTLGTANTRLEAYGSNTQTTVNTGDGVILADASGVLQRVSTSTLSASLLGATASKVATFNGDIDVTGTIDPTRILFTNLAGVNSPSYTPASNGNNYRIEFAEGGGLNFQSASTSNILQLNNDGKVGVGISNPARKLEVQDASGNIARFGWNAADYLDIVAGGVETRLESSGTRPFKIRTNGVDHMTVLSPGYVGIGTNTPTAQLHTTGTVRLSGFGAGTLTTDASGNVTASSDERLKDIQGDFTRGLEDLKKIKPITYKWNDISGLEKENSYSGFSAQNVQSAIPEAVSTDPRGYLSLQERPILATVVNAIKELADKIEKFADEFTSKKINTEQLCIGATCLSEDDIKNIKSGTYQSPAPVATPVAGEIGDATSGSTTGGTLSCQAGTQYDSTSNSCVAIPSTDATTTDTSTSTTTPDTPTVDVPADETVTPTTEPVVDTTTTTDPAPTSVDTTLTQ